ncbi:MAG: DUF5615 family PIN-like protein [Deinococcota bacterium]
MTFFLDRNLGRKFAQHLIEAEIPVLQHDDLFSQTRTDQAWIQVVGEQGLVAVTRDKRIGQNYLEQRAVALANLKLIVVIGGNVKTEELAENFISTRMRLERFADKYPAPFIAKLSRPSGQTTKKKSSGAIRMYKSRDELLKLIH